MRKLFAASLPLVVLVAMLLFGTDIKPFGKFVFGVLLVWLALMLFFKTPPETT
jgi:hypothetical protein